MAASADIIVIGGGPAGATAAIQGVRRGCSVRLIEKSRHPRFHIGESLLPRQTTLLRELGLLERALELPHVLKYGASFAMAHDADARDFWFSPGPAGEEAYAVSLERAPFDDFLLRVAREEGVEVVEDCSVRSIDSLGESGATLTTDAGEVLGRIVIDASGQSTVLARHLGTRKGLPDLKRVAYFQHFRGVARRPGRVGGHPIIVMCQEGWFWLIPLDEERTSVGLVMEHETAKAAGVDPSRMLAWGIERAPFVRSRMADAIGPAENHVCADFSYTCEPYAGPGYFLVGDAATFVDPIFSTGVCLGMMSGVKAADAAAEMVRGATDASRLRDEYSAYVRSSSRVFFRLVRQYYGHGFREMFLHGTGPVGVHDAVLSALAGHVFPNPVLSTRWRLWLFGALQRVHGHVGLVPGREGYSLIEGAPVPRERVRQARAATVA